MDRYGRVQESSQSDPSPEWTAPGPESGLEEGVWELGIGEGEGEPVYPERPDVADCMYYLRTGFCGYGARCRFNHPRDRTAVLGPGRGGGSGGEFPERMGQPVCQYYMRTGACKFRASCKYHHPRQGGAASVPSVPLNYYGYPMRPGEKECTYYVKTGQCKFGATCKFDHPWQANTPIPGQPLTPQAAPAPGPAPIPSHSMYPTMQSPSMHSSQQYGVVARPPMMPGSYVQGPYGPVLISPGVVPYPGWSTYPAQPVSSVASPGSQPAVGSGSMYGITQLSPSAPAYTGAYQPIPTTIGPSSSSQMDFSFPERPGQPECQYYIKTGDCKFGSSCRYHHPPPQSVGTKTNVVLSPLGFPLRPGAPTCTHYTQRGQCKFGPACRFDHPIMDTLSCSPSASSLADMPVAPYPVGSSIGTLAPSSSSTDLRTKANPNKDSSSTRMSLSLSTSSGSVGSVFSKTGPGPHSSSQESGPPSASSVTTDPHHTQS